MGHFHGDVLLFRADERPDFVNLNTLSGDVANHYVVELKASRADFGQQAKDGSFGNASHADGRADRTAFNQRRDHRDFLVHTQPIHTLIIHDRFSIARETCGWTKEKLLCGFRLFGGSVLVPSSVDSNLRGCFPLFWRHSLKPTFPADLAAPAAHLGHNLGNHRRFHDGISASAYQRFIDYPSGVLYNVKPFRCSFWHVPSMARIRKRFKRVVFQIDPLPIIGPMSQFQVVCDGQEVPRFRA
jgi:hypothetical protein